MEKITKEELLENLGWTPLSDEELTKVSGGLNLSGIKVCDSDQTWSDELNKCVCVWI